MADRISNSLNDAIANISIKSMARETNTATTGGTGNIATGISAANGKHLIIGACCTSGDYYMRAWVAQASNGWYLTVINPNTGAIVANTSVSYAYWHIETN